MKSASGSSSAGSGSPVRVVRTLGVDPGTLRMGFGVLDARGSAITLVTSGVVETPPSWPPARRLGELAARLEEVIATTRPDAVALEASFFGKNLQSLIRLGEARGMVLALAGRAGLEVHDYSPATVKKSVTGSGAASKEQLARVLAALLPELRRDGAPDGTILRLDQTDALAVAWCHLHHQKRAALEARIAASTPRR
jgi:crossover junction endodeoxyribonuclease RuvC